MKVRITKMPVRIKDKRYNIGDTLEVDKKTYETIKSICIVVEEEKPKKQTKKANKIKKKSKSKKKMTKDEVMIKLAEKGIAFDPNNTVDELLKLLE